MNLNQFADWKDQNAISVIAATKRLEQQHQPARVPNFAPSDRQNYQELLSSPPTIHDAKLATFTDSQPNLTGIHPNDTSYYCSTQSDNPINMTQLKSNQITSYIDTTINN